MNLGTLFWILYIVIVAVSMWLSWPLTGHNAAMFFAYVLIFLLGWKVFGFVVKE